MDTTESTADQLIKLYKYALAIILKNKLLQLNLDLSATFDENGLSDFSITVYDLGHDNKTFDFYLWSHPEVNELNLKKVIDSIKTNDLLIVKQLIINH